MKELFDKSLKSLSITFLAMGMGIFSSCCNGVDTPADTKYLPTFHEINFEGTEDFLKPDNMSLYVDYSTCMSMALQTSPFFKAMIPSLTAATKSYYSIKGDSINKEDGQVFTLLSNIQNTNYADILTAAKNIVEGKSEGVLLTDGEFYEPTVAKSHVNDPYLKDVFSEWLKKGHDIYVIAEPYKEAYNGNVYDKKRFYFLFTDSRVPNNIYDRITQCVDLKNYPDVDIYHMSVSHPTIMAEGTHSTPDASLAADIKGYGDFEIQEWNIDWNSIQDIFLNANVDENGNPLPNGKPVISGRKIDRNSFGCFRIKDIALKVYNVNEPYMELYGNKVSGLKLTKMQAPLQETTNFLVFDEKEFNAHGMLNISLDPAFNDACLDGSPYNYTKVDICVNGVDYVFDNYSSMFDFQSIDVPGQTNSSVTESIKQCLTDPVIKKMMNNALIYTIYIKSNKN